MLETMYYPTIDLKATGENIKRLRKARGIKVQDISTFMGFTEPQAVYKWQRGESLPTMDNLFALARLFGVRMDDIVIGFGSDEASTPDGAEAEALPLAG